MSWTPSRGRRFRRRLVAWLRRSAPRALAGALVAVALLGVGELLARALTEARTSLRAEAGNVMLPHPTRLWAPAADATVEEHGVVIRTDGDGLRRARREDAPDDAPRVLTLGDSSVFGHGNADGDTFHDRLDLALESARVRARVRCAGVSGYSSVQGLILMDEVGWSWRPDLLVVGYLWSDANADTFQDAALLGQARAPGARALRLLQRSALFRGVRSGVDVAAGRPASRQVSWPETSTGAATARVPAAEYLANLEHLASVARSRDVGMLVLGLPHRDEVAGTLRGRSDWDTHRAIQRAFAAAHGLPYVDGNAVFGASGSSVAELFQDGVHPTAKGQALLADEAARLLLVAGWPAERLVPADGAVPASVLSAARVPGAANPRSVQRAMWEGARQSR